MNKNKRLSIILLSSLGLLLIPLVAMQFSNEVKWTALDFGIMGALLAGCGLLFELIFRNVKKPGYRFALHIALILIFILIWAELAVGIFGSSFAGH